jgi:hypothetical protein
MTVGICQATHLLLKRKSRAADRFFPPFPGKQLQRSMSRVVLHIGTHKTATTTVQDTFALNAGLLARHGLVYPLLGGPVSGHHGLAADWNALLQPYALPGGSVTALRAMTARHAAGQDTVFLSSEELSRGRAGGRVDFGQLREALAGFDRIEVICMLREQWRFVQSVYLEVSKRRQPKAPAGLLKDVLRHDMVTGLWTDYGLLYRHLREAFAASEITLFDYDLCTAAPGGVFGALLSHLGLGLDPAQLEPANGGQSNVSPPPLAGWAANTISAPEAAPPWLVEAASGAFRVQYGAARPGTIWSAGELQQLLDYGRKANDRLIQMVTDEGRKADLPLGALSPPEDLLHPSDLGGVFWRRTAQWAFGPSGEAAAQLSSSASSSGAG